MEERNTKIARDVAQYDMCVKRVLGQKIILAHILKNTVHEFKDLDPNDIVKLIEDDINVGTVPIEPGFSNSKRGNRIVGLNTENFEINEGLIRYDIVFYIRTKDGLSKIIVNIEAQKDLPSKYKLLNRAIFYASRLISSQKERDFINSNYDDIKKVYSIWICMNMPHDILSHFHLTKDELLNPYNWKGNIDLFNIILIGIDDNLSVNNEDYNMHQLLKTLVSSKLKQDEKLDIINKEYNISVNEDLRKEVEGMCNLGEGLVERTAKESEEKANEKIILSMLNKGYSFEQIADIFETGSDSIEKIIEKHNHDERFVAER